jgi:hypothetical protein
MWVPLLFAGVCYSAVFFLNGDSTSEVKLVKSMDAEAYRELSTKWIEGTYRSVGLGVTEGLQSKLGIISQPMPVYIRNPITDFALRNNLSIACLQMDGLWSVKGKEDIFVLEGNITFKGDYPFNSHLNNTVVYTKSYYLRDSDRFWLMSSSIDKSKKWGQEGICNSSNVAVTRKIRFDSYLEQMNSLTFPTGYLAFDVANFDDSRKRFRTSYITNEEYVSLMNKEVPTNIPKPKTAQSSTALLLSFLSVPGALSGSKVLDKQAKAIKADKKVAKYLNDKYAYASDIRFQYLTRMSEALMCETSIEYEDICSLGGETVFRPNRILKGDNTWYQDFF